MDMKKLLVLGVGNILLKDEGIGVHAVRTFWEEKWPDSVDFIDGGTFTQDLFYLFQEYEHIVVLDVVKGGREPGTIYRLAEKDLRDNPQQSLSLHDIDLLDSLKMAEMVGNRPELTVIGIEPHTLDWDLEMTPTLQAAFPGFVQTARKEILGILGH
jgi:hydrogenase maturation protease